MQSIQFPHIVLPVEFITLLKTNIAVTTTFEPIFEVIRTNRAIYFALETAFKEFDSGRGLEKTMMALGWSNFRDRMASVYVHKAISGDFPSSTSMSLVDDIKQMEQRYSGHGIHSLSRIFLLGFYFKMVNVEKQKLSPEKLDELAIPDELDEILQITQGRSEKIDWLILITLHFMNGLGKKIFMNALVSGKNFMEIYYLLDPDLRRGMLNNLLAYGASIREEEVFLYERI